MDDYVIDGDLVFIDQSSALKFYREQYHKKKEWQGLTDEEILEVRENCHKGMAYPQDAIVGPRMMKLVEGRAIEAKLKEKNG